MHLHARKYDQSDAMHRSSMNVLKRGIYDIKVIVQGTSLSLLLAHAGFLDRTYLMTTQHSPGVAVITGASTGIGAIYADRLARRGYDLVLVARNRERLDALARQITDNTHRSVEVIAADLNNATDLAQVETKLRTDASVTLLVNNAGVGATTPLLGSD
ncbi:MAG TPA: SDR family NAD(P)-dependent oxidoreductase, partial [Steroidobacteraceae bacterium]